MDSNRLVPCDMCDEPTEWHGEGLPVCSDECRENLVKIILDHPPRV